MLHCAPSRKTAKTQLVDKHWVGFPFLLAAALHCLFPYAGQGPQTWTITNCVCFETTDRHTKIFKQNKCSPSCACILTRIAAKVNQFLTLIFNIDSSNVNRAGARLNVNSLTISNYPVATRVVYWNYHYEKKKEKKKDTPLNFVKRHVVLKMALGIKHFYRYQYWAWNSNMVTTLLQI